MTHLEFVRLRIACSGKGGNTCLARTCLVARSAQPRQVASVLDSGEKNIVVLNQNYANVQHVSKNTAVQVLSARVPATQGLIPREQR